MSRIMEFGIIPVFRCPDGQLIVQSQMLFPSEVDARRAAEIFAEVLGGAVAFSRVVDHHTGFAEDGVILGKFGVLDSKAQPKSQDQAHQPVQDKVDDGTRSLRENPERYIVTFFEAQLRLCELARLSRQDALTDFSRMWETGGRVENLELDFADEESDGGTHRHCPPVPVAIELLAREARSLREVDETCADARWFMKMTGAWAFALAGTNAEAAWKGSHAYAIEADEEAFFDRVLAPWIAHRFRVADSATWRVDHVGEDTESFGAARIGAIRQLKHAGHSGQAHPR